MQLLLSVTMKVDFIIVGQGLAGTLLAFELLNRGKSVFVFDDPDQPKASEVAAGLINPIVFRRMTKSWLVDDAFPQLESTYRKLEELVQEQLYYPGRMLRYLNEDEFRFWKKKVSENQLQTYLETEPNMKFKGDGMIPPVGFGCVNKSGRLDVQKLISSFSAFLTRQSLIRKEKFDYEKLVLQPDQVSYRNMTSDQIIFCEGATATQNPYFRNLTFKHSKGEILVLKIPELKLNEILSQEIFVMPIGNNWYKVGATYSWDELNWETTDRAREELLGKLKSLISGTPEIIEQKAGIRPTMHDRKPVIGMLPDNPQVGIFNGLGSKGVLLGPYFARQFTDYLIGTSAYIHPEADVSRYFRRKQTF